MDRTPNQPSIDVDRPGLKDRLWHSMRADLARYMPQIIDSDLLLCPACCRLLNYSEFDIEHVIPKQAVDEDPPEVRVAVSKDQRSGTILLCRKTLKIGGVKQHGLGCNSWKGKHFDRSIASVLRQNALVSQPKGQMPWTTSMFVVGFLALFHQYGFQVVLTHAGLSMRRQFFSPSAYLPDMPLGSQILLMGSDYKPTFEENLDYWARPFRFAPEASVCMVMVRHIALRMPISRNPELPIARHVRFAPKRYVLAPSFSTVFD